MKRITLVERYVFQDKLILVIPYPLTKDIPLVVSQMALQRVPIHPMPGFYGLFNQKTHSRKGKRRTGAQPYLLTIMSWGCHSGNVKNQGIILFPSLNHRMTKPVIHHVAATRQQHGAQPASYKEQGFMLELAHSFLACFVLPHCSFWDVRHRHWHCCPWEADRHSWLVGRRPWHCCP